MTGYTVSESAPVAIDATLGQLGTGTSQPLDPGTNPLSLPIVFPDGTTHTVQPLVWGGQVFYDQPSFDAWAKSRSIALSDYFTRYPEAGRIYAQLAPAGSKETLATGERLADLRILAVLPTQDNTASGDLTDTMTVTWEIIGLPGTFTVDVPFDASWPAHAVSAMLAKEAQVKLIYAGAAKG